MTQVKVTQQEFAEWLAVHEDHPTLRGLWGAMANRIADALGVEFAPEPTPADDEPGTVRMSPDGPVVKRAGGGSIPWTRFYRSREGYVGTQLVRADQVSMDWPIVAQVPAAHTHRDGFCDAEGS